MAVENCGWVRSPHSRVEAPQYPDQNRPQRPVMLAVVRSSPKEPIWDCPPGRPDRADTFEVGKREDMEQLGAGRARPGAPGAGPRRILSMGPAAVVEGEPRTTLDKSSLHMREVRIPDLRRRPGKHVVPYFGETAC